MSRINFDDLYFFSLMFASLLISINGKVWSQYLFGEVNTLSLQQEYLTIKIYFVLIASCILFFGLRISSLQVPVKSFYCALIGLVSSILVLIWSETPSVLIFFLILGIYMHSTLVFAIETFFKDDMKPEFWQIIFQSAIKLLQFSLVAIAVMVATIRYFHQGDTSDFISTLFYPLIVITIQYFVLANWIMYPCFKIVVKKYKIKNNIRSHMHKN